MRPSRLRAKNSTRAGLSDPVSVSMTSALNGGLSGILIAGTSHVGKTTLAKRLAETLGWTMISSDSLARHPGRPWPNVREPVAEFYSSLSPETIYWFLRVHHDNMWPRIGRVIEDEIGAGRPFVFEGSALRPRSIAPVVSDAVTAACLHAETEFLERRMRSEAGYDAADPETRLIMDRFIERSLRDNSKLRSEAEENGIRVVDAADAQAIDALFGDLVLRALAGKG